jgi:nitrite reductase/ring-hydroxylating ferredoxin subunit
MRPRRLRRQVERITSGLPLRRARASADDQAVLRTAIALKAASSRDEPDAAFVADLARQLKERREPAAAPSRRPTRRAVLAGSLTAALGGAAGVVVGALGFGGRRSPQPSGTLQPSDSAWTAIASPAELRAQRAVLFEAHGVHGVLSTDQDGGPVAVSGVCTHQGCVLLLALQQPQPSLNCPCHRASFALNGAVLSHQLAQDPARLPRLEARIRGGQAEVLLPQNGPGPSS